MDHINCSILARRESDQVALIIILIKGTDEKKRRFRDGREGQHRAAPTQVPSRILGALGFQESYQPGLCRIRKFNKFYNFTVT